MSALGGLVQISKAAHAKKFCLYSCKTVIITQIFYVRASTETIYGKIHMFELADHTDVRNDIF